MTSAGRWTSEAIRRIEADFQRSADTHLIRLDLPVLSDIDVYLKDESTHPSGSLKHRLARSLFLYGLCNGWITQSTPVIEASSGSTAVSEAYFARLLGLEFIAVMPRGTSPQKIAKIQFYGGRPHLVDPDAIYAESARLAADLGGHYMDQFTFAERATDWRGNNNIAESIFSQMARERFATPAWVVVSAGTGGTSATIGRYIRYRHAADARTSLCVVDPENSVFYDFYQGGDRSLTISSSSRIEGIGRPRVEPSFVPSVVDRMIRVPDAASIATIQFLERLIGRRCGGSTGTNVYGTFQILSEMRARGEQGSVVTMICDSGDRYSDTYYNPQWIESEHLQVEPYRQALEEFERTGLLPAVS